VAAVDRPRRSVALAAAALFGAAGLALEVLWIAALGPAVGAGRAAPLGLGLWVAGWALGARAAGRCPRPVLSGGLGAAAASAALLAALARHPSAFPAPLALAGLTLTAFGQGLALPALAAAGGVRAAWALNLAGAVLGARLAAWELPAALGLDGAAWAASAAAAAAGLLGGSASDTSGQRRATAAPAAARIPVGAGLLLGAATGLQVVVQGTGVRLAAVWLGGHQDTAALVLVASLAALALGAALLAPLLPQGRAGVGAVLVLAALGALAVALGPGAWLGAPFDVDLEALARSAPLALTFAIVGPPLAPLGALVPALARACGARGSAGLGALLVHESWGGFCAALLFPWWLVPHFGLTGALAAALAATGLAALALHPRGWWVWSVLGAAAVWSAAAPSPVRGAPALANPAFTVLELREDADYAVTVVDDGLRGERTLLTDNFRATATGVDYLYMRALGHLPVLLHPAPKRVAVLALGTGATVGAVARHRAVERIDVLELSRAVVAAAPHFAAAHGGALDEGLPGLLDEHDGRARVVVHLGDGRRLLRDLAQQGGRSFDVLTMEPLLPDAPFAVHLYTEGFYRDARAALAPGGLVCQWLPPHALAPEVAAAVCAAFAGSFPWSAAFLHGTQVLLVGGDAAPQLDSAHFAQVDLAADLAALALDSPASLAALLVSSPVRFGLAPLDAAPERRLTDRDPWILYRPRPRGAEALGYLPRNLIQLRRGATALPEGWDAAVGPEGRARRAAFLGVLACREAWSAHRALAAGLRDLPAEGRAAGELAEVDRRRRAFDGHPDEGHPPFAWLDGEVRFEHHTGQGLGALLAGDARRALGQLERAAAARPERADGHLHVALAAARAGDPARAGAALARALASCPRLLETRPARRAVELGLGDALSAAKAALSGLPASK